MIERSDMIESEPVLFMTIGIPGSGKSSIMKTFPKEYVISSDDVRTEVNGDINDQSNSDFIWRLIAKRLINLLKTHGIAILDGTNVGADLREDFLEEIREGVDTPIKTVAIVFHVDPEVAKKRIAKDIEAGKDRSDVPEDIVDDMYAQFRSGYSRIEQQFDKVISGDKSA
jgi:predicted kinase